MPKFPWPPVPGVLSQVTPEHHLLRAGALLARIYARGGPSPSAWGSFRRHGPLATARFDHHVAGEPRGVIYAAPELRTCVAEVFQGSRVIDRFADQRCLAAFRVTRTVRLLDLTGDWPTRAGASQAVASGPRARAWARAVYDAYPDVAGLWYPSSMPGGRPAVVLFERAEPAVPEAPELDVALSHPGLVADLVRAAGALGYLLR